jgi:hypothetical protein
MKLIFNKYWATFLLVKFFWMVFALFIFKNYVQLADLESFLNGSYIDFDIIFSSATSMTGFVAFTLGEYIGYIGANIVFMLIAFYGIYRPVNKLNLSKRNLIFCLFLLSLPSFGIWTSIVGKEAISVFFMGMLASYLIDIHSSIRRPQLIELFALYLGLIFKLQYVIPVLVAFFYILIKNKLKLSSLQQLTTLLLILFFSIYLVWEFSDEINRLSFVIISHFSTDATSTRDPFWINDYDVFYKSITGIFVSFIGPTFSESLNRPAVMPFFIESFLIFSIFLSHLLYMALLGLTKYSINIYKLSLFVIIFLGILTLSYPLGVSNYSTAIRYREGYYGFLVVFYFFLFVSNKEMLKK